MDTQHDTTDPAIAYAASVDRERDAWQALQARPPGTPGRAEAWEAWSAAIVETNHAWRRLNARRFSDPARRGQPPAGRHANA